MRDNTYIKLESICKKYKGYVRTQKLLEEGFSNRQIAFLTKDGYLEKICYGVYWINGRGYDKPLDYKCIEVCLSAPKLLFVWIVRFIIMERLQQSQVVYQ